MEGASSLGSNFKYVQFPNEYLKATRIFEFLFQKFYFEKIN